LDEVSHCLHQNSCFSQIIEQSTHSNRINNADKKEVLAALCSSIVKSNQINACSKDADNTRESHDQNNGLSPEAQKGTEDNRNNDGSTHTGEDDDDICT
jgi:hypothetical protein